MKPGQVILLPDSNGNVRRWRVEATTAGDGGRLYLQLVPADQPPAR